MTVGPSVAPADAWPPPRKLPRCYPGGVPPQHYLLVDGMVHPLHFERAVAWYLVEGTSWRAVDDLLADRGLPLLAERCGIATYGANRNPGTLAIKMDHYKYRSPGRGQVMPVLRGWLRGAEAVASGLSGQGYFYADLVLHEPSLVADELEVWINLADAEQVRVLHDSEGVGAWYRAVVLAEVFVKDLGHAIRPLAYVTNGSALVPPGHGSPVALSSVRASGRRLPALDQVGLWDAVLDGIGQRQGVANLTGIGPGPGQGTELMKYLNGQWWYQHNTGDTALAGATHVVAAVQGLIQAEGRPLATLAKLAASGAVLSTEAAYGAGPEHGIAPVI